MKIPKNIQTIIILFLVATMSSCGLFLQKSGLKNYSVVDKIDKKGLNKYQYDFVYLSHLVEQGFPQIDSIFPISERKKRQIEILDVLSGDDVEKIDFAIQSRKYLSNFHNEHTSISVKSKSPTIYPFLIHISYNNWYLLNVDKKQDSVFIGKQIVEINEIEINDIESRLFKFTSAENKINQQYEIRNAQLYNKPLYLKEINVIKNVTEKIKITFTDNTSIYIDPINSSETLNLYNVLLPPHEITKQKTRTYSYQLYPNQDFGYLQFRRCHDKIDILEGIESYVKPWIRPVARRYVKRQFRKDKPSKRIAGYYNSEYPIFKDFIWELIDSLNNNNIENFVIDLRQNPGGNLTLAIQLMYFLTNNTNAIGFAQYAYTTDIYKNYFPVEYNKLRAAYPEGIPQNALVLKNANSPLFDEITDNKSLYYIPENRPIYEGNIYVIANYTTGSAAAMLTTLLQDSEIATIIGTSVGNNPTGATSFTPFTLPKTKARISIASSYQERPNKLNGEILKPTYWIEYSIKDITTGNDPFLEKIKELIREDH